MNKAFWKHFKRFGRLLGKWFICSSLPARLMEEFPASKVRLQPVTWLTGTFSQQSYVQTLLASLGMVIGKNSARQWQIEHTSYLRHQRTKFPQTPWIVYFSVTLSLSFHDHIIFSKYPSQQKIAWRTYIKRNRSIGCPWKQSGTVAIDLFRCRVDVLQSSFSRGTISIAVFCLQNLICLLVIFADQVTIDPTFCDIFVCDPLIWIS